MEFYQQYLEKYTRLGTPITNLSRFAMLCEKLGNPHQLLRFVHLAGTNGKGSICEYMSSALIADGRRVGKFTSPYVIRINERISVNDTNISDEDLSFKMKIVADAVEKCDDKRFSQFELLTAAALIYFVSSRTDIVILEAGIGGTLDCTNIVTPLISVIGKIDFDHCGILGNSLTEIATHKAGIIKEGIPCVAYPDLPETLEVHKKTARKKRSTLITPSMTDLTIHEHSVFGNVFTYKDEKYSTTMGGEHQVYNAVTAIEALEMLHVTSSSIKQGLNTAMIQARLQVLKKNPLIVIDGAHNVDGIEAAAKLVGALPCRKTAVFGSFVGKDYENGLLKLLPRVDKVVFVDDFADNTVPVSDMVRRAKEIRFDGGNVFVKPTKEALPFAESISEVGMVLVCGSLYLAGAILREFGE